MANVTRLAPDFLTVVVPPRRVIPAEIRAEINAIWNAATHAGDKFLFDGPIFHLEHAEPRRIEISPDSFRSLYAQSRFPEWRDQPFGLRALGVTGLLFCPEGLVLGRRAGIVSANAGLWEPAPAGVLDRPEPIACLMTELAEELGIQVTEITSVLPCAVVESNLDGNADLVFRLETRLSLAAIEIRKSRILRQEYQDLTAIPESRLMDPAISRDYRAIDTLTAMLDLADSA